MKITEDDAAVLNKGLPLVHPNGADAPWSSSVSFTDFWWIEAFRRSVEALGWDWDSGRTPNGSYVVTLEKDMGRRRDFRDYKTLEDAWLAAGLWLAKHRIAEAEKEEVIEVVDLHPVICGSSSWDVPKDTYWTIKSTTSLKPGDKLKKVES
jgi:hypothetical protein